MSIPTKMKAAVLFAPGDLRIVEKDVPKPGKYEVLIKVKACAICGSDPKIVKNGWPGSPPFGEFTPGHEFAGEIAAVGEEVTAFKIGDRVAVEPHKGCGHCINCIRGKYTTCLNYGINEEGHRHYGFTADGGYAEYAVCNINCLHKFSEDMTFEKATLITTAGTALYGIQRAGWIWPGETVVIIGPGPIGLMTAQIAKTCGAGKVIVTGTRKSRLDVALEVGADAVINVREQDLEQEVLRLTDGMYADMVVETSGTTIGATQAVDIVKKNGRIAYEGIYSEPASIDINKVVQWNVQIAGGKAEGEFVLERIVPLMETGRIVSEPIITNEFALDDINEALNVYINRIGGAIKVVVKP